jgi:hypothetical protein
MIIKGPPESGETVVAEAACRKDLMVKEPLESSKIDADEAKADFMEYCLGGPAAMLEVEIERAAEEAAKLEVVEEAVEEVSGQEISSTFGTEVPFGVQSQISLVQSFSLEQEASAVQSFASFSLGEASGSDTDEDEQDLEDMFDFDPQRLAGMMNADASPSELMEHLQESYAIALERRLSSGASEARARQEASAQEAADDAMRPSLQTDNLSPLMTPDKVTPVGSPRGAADSAGGCIASRAQAALEAGELQAEARARRSVAMQHRPSAAQRGEIAVRAMESFGRQSLAAVANSTTAEERSALTGAVSDAMRRASRRHRRSVAMAAEVLEEVAEASNKPLDKWSDEQIDSQVEHVQQAMEEAYRRHRRSIVNAVNEVTASDPVEMQVEHRGGSTSAVEERIRTAIASAHKRRQLASCQQSDDQNQWVAQDQWGAQWYSQVRWSEPWLHGTYEETWCSEPRHCSQEPLYSGHEWALNTSGTSWNAASEGYGPCINASKCDAWGERLHGIRAPWRYGSA